ncbi:MAG: amino acid adenylation domain-containing protein, partial [Pricia sp.]
MTKDSNKHLPLTQSQLSLWAGQRMHPDIPLNNAAYTYDIAGVVDKRIFQKAFQQVLDTTDALRMVFGEENGIAFQSVRAPFRFNLEIIDFSSAANGDTKDKVEEDVIEGWIQNRIQKPLLPADRIFDTVLLKISESRYLWYLNIDHLVTDAISFKLIYERMDSVYRSIISGSTEESFRPPAYLDYIRFEKEQVDHPDARPHRTYWKEKMADRPDVPKLYGMPLDPNSTVAPRIAVELGKKRMHLLRQIVQDPEVWSLNQDLTEFSVFATLYFIFLHRVSGQQRLAIGSPAHNRTSPNFRKTAGLFLEVLPLYSEITANDTFNTVLERVQEETLSYLRHVRPGMASSEIGQSFSAVFNYINADFPNFNGFPTQTKWVHSGHMDSSHAIRCHIYDFQSNGKLEVAFDLNRSVFSEAIAGRVPEHFLNLFDALLQDRNLPIGKPALTTNAEREMLLGTSGSSDVPEGAGSESVAVAAEVAGAEDVAGAAGAASAEGAASTAVAVSAVEVASLEGMAGTANRAGTLNKIESGKNKTTGGTRLSDKEKRPTENRLSILEAFDQQASRRPNAVALQCGSEILTYGGLRKRADLLARYLRGKDIGPGHKVALHLSRSPEYLIGILGVLKTGAAFIPIATDQPSERVDYMVSNSACSLVLTAQSFEEIPSGELASDLTESGLMGFDSFASDSMVSDPKAFNSMASDLKDTPKSDSTAYILYTSGSTGHPKGVAVSHAALNNYMSWAGKYYEVNETSSFPLFTSIGFDLTLTSTLLPLLNGGRVIIYPEKKDGPDLALMQVIEDNLVDTIKLTPSHLALLQNRDLHASSIKIMIIGGEDLKSGLAESIASAFPKDVKIFNEYGPTEATIGCIVGRFDLVRHTGTSVPIGKPIDNMQALVLDSYLNPVPQGVVGELYLSGVGLAEGYVGDPNLTQEKFLDHPYKKNTKMYRTGDLARINADGEFEYLGRTDDQIKLRGHRIELAEIESLLSNFPGIDQCAVVLVDQKENVPENEVVNCLSCGLPSNYPNTDFDGNGVCHLCSAFEDYKHKVERYFQTDDELVRILTSKRSKSPHYDCISLLSGGKDSTYVLARLVNMGLNVLAFTLDNGYISDQAKANVDRIVGQLGVDHVYGETPHMNEIFVDSLHRHHNVCNGCFKTIYTLSTQIALEKNIPFIVTGLSRGQFFETRLTEELFWDDATGKIDDTILEARKLYHREPDAVKNLLDVSAFESDTIFEKVQFVDFYRYSDVSLEKMLEYLKDKVGWVRPSDTGRSTNCLINQVGIYVHKKEEGYSNYAFPYSWDVRLGHKTREESLEEI